MIAINSVEHLGFKTTNAILIRFQIALGLIYYAGKLCTLMGKVNSVSHIFKLLASTNTKTSCLFEKKYQQSRAVKT